MSWSSSFKKRICTLSVLLPTSPSLRLSAVPFQLLPRQNVNFPILRRFQSFPQPARFNLFFIQRAEYNSVFIFKMTSLIIAVGSTRKPKLAAVHEALGQVASLFSATTQFEIRGIEVESGVTHTPSNRAELMQGARQRAEAVRCHTTE
jgi:uncharacterized protein DUF84